MAQKVFIVGRNPNVSQGEIAVRIDDPSKKVSSNHCRITYDGAIFYLEDLSSTNGTFINGHRISTKNLIEQNQSFSMGKKFSFSISNSIINDIIFRQTKTVTNEIGRVEESVNENIDENKLYISSFISNKLPAMVKNELAKMNPQKQEEFVEEYKRKTKSIGITYLFLIIILAMHYGYLKKWGLQFVFWFTGGGFFIWAFIDLFRVPGMVNDYNKDMALETMRNLKATST